MFGMKQRILAALAGTGLASKVSFGDSFDSGEPLRYGHTVPARNGGTLSGAAASKRAAAKRRNVRARSSRK